MVEAGCEFFDLSGLTVGADAAQDEDCARAGVGEEEIAVGRGADEARLGEGATREPHVSPGIGALQGSGVAAGVERDLEAWRSDGPGVGRTHDEVGGVVDGLRRVGLRKIAERDLVTNARVLLAPVGKRGLPGEDGLLG